MAAGALFPLTWELGSLLPHPETPEFRRVLEQFGDDLRRLANESERLPPVETQAANVTRWAAFLHQFAVVDSLASDLRSFAGCHAAADAANKKFQRLEAELSALDPLREQILTNIEFALVTASDDEFRRFTEADPHLREIGFFLHIRRRNAALRLPKEQELLSAALAVDGLHAWGRLYDRLSGALRVRVMERGQIVEKSPGQVLFDSPQRAVRENNFYAADAAWQGIEESCADALNHISGTRLTVYQRLGLRDHLEAPLRSNRMTRETLEAMWGTVTQHKGALTRYLDRKARLLGLERLAWYDLQAPLSQFTAGPSNDELSYDEACAQIIRGFGRFSDDLGEFARMALERRWVEAENRTGKRQGGFCTGFPTPKQSRIFMTFTNSPDSMSTLAHELGHAYHSHVLRDQPYFLMDYPMNLAETASTFAEAVLGEQRLAETDSATERLSLLDQMLSDAVAFLMNIHARFLFEDQFHKERPAGELPPERFSELMVAAQKEAYLNALADEGWNPRFWASKLHFYISGLPFYNFPYTFGYLLSLGLYGLAGDVGREFPERYRRLLIATGNQEAEDAVQSTFGYNLRDAAFWERSLSIIARRVEQFVALADELPGTTTTV